MIKEKRKKQKRRKLGLYIFLGIVLLIALMAYFILEVCKVEKVVVDGNEWYSSKQIEDMLLNDEYSWNSLYVFLKYRFQEIGEVPFVDDMEISLDDPHTVRIKVYEKGILGYLYIPIIGQNAYFDKDGFVVETSLKVIPNVPKITGVKCSQVVLYEKLQLEDEGIFRFLLNLTQTLKKYDLEPNEIDFDLNENANIHYGDIHVIVGDEENLSQKIIRLSHILPQLKGLSGTLHLENWTEETTDIVFDKEEKIPETEEAEESVDEAIKENLENP